MVVVGHDETEIDVVGIIDNLHGRGLVIRTRPGAATVFFEEHIFARASRAGTLGYREFRISQNWHTGPLSEIAIDNNGFRSKHHRVSLLTRLDIVGS